MKKLLHDSRGANMVEYILLVGIVALISIAAFQKFGFKIRSKVDEQSSTVSNINSGSGN
jgi:pilus assembly protein Flp/PilA